MHLAGAPLAMHVYFEDYFLWGRGRSLLLGIFGIITTRSGCIFIIPFLIPCLILILIGFLIFRFPLLYLLFVSFVSPILCSGLFLLLSFLFFLNQNQTEHRPQTKTQSENANTPKRNSGGESGERKENCVREWQQKCTFPMAVIQVQRLRETGREREKNLLTFAGMDKSQMRVGRAVGQGGGAL